MNTPPPVDGKTLIEAARRHHEHGPAPRGPVLPGAPPAALVPLEGERGYDPDADLADQSGARSFTMPNGGKVWVHPISAEESLWLNRQAGEYCATKLKLTADDPHRLPAYKMMLWVYHAIVCTRHGADPDSPLVWTVDHAPALFRNRKPGIMTLKRISGLSDAITEGLSAVDYTPEQVLFFESASLWLRTCATRWKTGSLKPSDGAAYLEAFADCVSRIGLLKWLCPETAAAIPVWDGLTPDDVTPGDLEPGGSE